MLGGAYAICDRCGFKVRHRKLRKEWSGWMVCRPCYDPRPADTRPPSLRPEGLPVRDARPEPPPIFREAGTLGFPNPWEVVEPEPESAVDGAFDFSLDSQSGFIPLIEDI